uniref:ATP synthase complex subunit 8 n=1 Tax=Mnais tenuis TaxID=193267 RepID=A0A6C0R3Q6_9ODON|nr:ATP synthase F0 subunit 8 [Mnais tenuis]QHZ87408.1 ATP synthase F0 subunit 8 [Mnais tenuis]QSH89865.1 ATP synthase F0 subunit 8 [Mnais tenuis]
MPQMAPMSWTILFLLFSMVMTFMATMNYYQYAPVTNKITTKSSTHNHMNWKW